jgi:hypothetical protein
MPAETARFFEIQVPDIALHPCRAGRFAAHAILALFALSLFLPANGSTDGWALFLWGMIYTLMVIGVPWTFPWLANPFLGVGLWALARGKLKVALWCGVAATLFAASWLRFPGVLGDVGIGYWIWLASMASVTVCAGILLALRSFAGSKPIYRDRTCEEFFEVRPAAAPASRAGAVNDRIVADR